MPVDRSRDAQTETAPAAPRGELLSGVAAVLDSVTPATRPIVLPGQRVREKLAGGVPLLHGEDVYVDASAVGVTWERLLTVFEAADDWTAKIDGGRAALAGHRLHAEHATAEALVSHPEHVRDVALAADAAPDLVERLATLAARPVLAAYARQIAPALSLAAWDRGYCPICGAWPVRGERSVDAADLRLRCARCATGWALAPSACPFCQMIDAPVGTVAAMHGQDTATTPGCRACGRALPLVESSEDAPALGALLRPDDVGSARDEPAGVPGPLHLPGAGFRLELADGEPDWDGFDDD